MKHAFFFGAGASVCAGMPTTDKMLKFLEEEDTFKTLREQYNLKDIEQLYTYLENLSNPMIPTFIAEQTISQSDNVNDTDKSNLVNKFKSYQDDIEEWKKKHMNKIQTYLVSHLDPKRTDVEDYTEMLRKLRHLDKNDKLTIITTNYDILLDMSLEEDWVDGFDGFPTVNENNRIKTWANKWEYPLFKHTLVKLHGSINWTEDRKHEKSKYRGINKYSHPCVTPIMLPLTLNDKDYSEEPYAEMLAKFKQIIQTIDLLVVVGYTFRDNRILDFIKERINSGMHVLLLSPDASKVAYRLGGRINILKFGSVVDSIYCDAKSDSTIYCCDKNFNSDTIDIVVMLVERMQKMIDDGNTIPVDLNI